MSKPRVLLVAIFLGLSCVPCTAFGGSSSGSSSGGGGGGGCASDDAVSYGWTVPGDPVYGFGAPDPNADDLVGLAAKGNLIIGDYTDPAFQGKVAPRLRPGIDSITQPYVVDPTDAALGYDSRIPSLCGGLSPCFDGNYDQADGGAKSDGAPRKFYESSLSNADFQRYYNKARAGDDSSYVNIEGALYTNHAIAGLVKTWWLGFQGSIVARDEAIDFYRSMWIDYDTRLLNDSGSTITLPASMKRPRLVSWEECPAAGCAGE